MASHLVTEVSTWTIIHLDDWRQCVSLLHKLTLVFLLTRDSLP